MISPLSRREFLRRSHFGLLAVAASPSVALASQPTFEISLSQLSLSSTLASQALDHLDFARVARREFGVTAVEYASRFFADQIGDEKFLAEMNRRAADEDVRQLLIVVEQQGNLGDESVAMRRLAVQAHQQWVDAARHLGCHSIELAFNGINNSKDGTQRLAEGLAELCDYAERQKINVLLTSANGQAGQGSSLNKLLKAVDRQCCCAALLIHGQGMGDQDAEVKQLASLAKAVATVTQRSEDNGLRSTTEQARQLKLVLEAGYRGYVSILYRGTIRDETEGILATRSLLERIRQDAPLP